MSIHHSQKTNEKIFFKNGTGRLGMAAQLVHSLENEALPSNNSSTLRLSVETNQ